MSLNSRLESDGQYHIGSVPAVLDHAAPLLGLELRREQLPEAPDGHVAHHRLWSWGVGFSYGMSRCYVMVSYGMSRSQGFGSRVQSLGFRIWGSRCEVQGAGCRVQGVGCVVQGEG